MRRRCNALLDARTGKSVTRLSGKVALITGGGTGIGRAIAVAFAREGASVAVAGRRLEKVKEVAAEIDQQGIRALPLVCDVARAKDADNAVAETARKFGKVNVLVNNAGTLSVSTVDTISEEDWDRVIAVN